MKVRLLFLGMLMPLFTMAQSWQQQYQLDGFINSIDCYDSESAIAVTQSRILYTTDGGKKWEPKNVSGYWHDVAFETKQVAYAVGDFNSYAMKKTTNGGNSWNDINMSNPPANTVTDICFAEGWGFAVGNDGIFLKYNGTKWDNVGISLPSRSSKFLESCYFIDKNTGFVVGDEDTGNDYEHIYPYIHSTVNGGSSWSHNMINLSTINGYGGRLLKIAFSKKNPNYGCAVGSYQKEKGGNMYGLICITKNKGTNWTVYPFDATSWLYSIAFADEKTVYAVGSNGTIIKKDITSSANWTKETSNTTSTVSDICFADANNGWAVGENGVILKYGEGNGNGNGNNDDIICEECVELSSTNRNIPKNGVAPRTNSPYYTSVGTPYDSKVGGVASRVIFEWEHEAGAGIVKYRFRIKKQSENVYKQIQGQAYYEKTVQDVPAIISIDFQTLNEPLNYNTLYEWQVTGYNDNNKPVAFFKRQFTTMNVSASDNTFGSAVGRLDDVVVYRNDIECDLYYQCAELANRYFAEIYNLNTKSNSYYTESNVGLKIYKNGKTKICPQRGDLLIFRLKGGGYHVAIVDRVVGNTLYVYQQNMNDGKTQAASSKYLEYPFDIENQTGFYTVKLNTNQIKTWSECLWWVRAEPTLLYPENNLTATVNTTTPDFTWEKHDGINNYTLYISELIGGKYQNIFSDNSGVIINNNGNKSKSIPELKAGNTYKWRIVANFNGGLGSLASKASYFKISSNATKNKSNSDISLYAEKHNTITVRPLGSVLSNATVYRQMNSEWLSYGKTDENGIVTLKVTPELELNDMLKITASGYEDLLVKVDQNILETAKIDVPMVRKTTPTNLIVNPSVVITSNVNSSNISIKINGENITSYSIFDNEDESVQPFAYPDNKEITYTLKNAGINYLTFALYNNVDTVYIDKVVTNVSSSVNTYNITVNPNQHHVKVYIDGYFGKDLSNMGTITLMEGEHELTFIQTGYKDSTINVTEATTINLALQPIQSDLLQTITPQSNIPTYAGNGITVMSSGNNGFIVSKSNLDYSTLGVDKLSETIEVTKATPNNDKISIFVALQPEKEIVTDNMYLLHISNGQYFKIFTEYFGDSISFDKSSDKLTYKNIYKQRENFVLAEKKAPVINTDLSFIINNPQLSIPLNYIASDPDKIDDITFQIKSISNDNYDVNIYEGYLSIIQKEKAGDLNIELVVTHDNINQNVVISVINNNVSSIQVKEIDTNIILYPNPTSDKVFLKHDASNIHIDKIHIFDIQGKLISALAHPNSSNIEILLPTSGNYFVSIFTNKGVITKKIIRK
jgi:photosystem II stability/assembly factor-like uncharacterized protein